MLSMLGALRRPTAGELRLSGIPVTELTERENVEVALNVAGRHGAAAHERAARLLAELGLGERLDFLPEQLSGGEKHRIAIACALANDPDLVLADEPTANLDSSIGREVMRRLREIAKRHNESVPIVSHDDRIREFVDRVSGSKTDSSRASAGSSAIPAAAWRQKAVATATIDGIDHFFCARGCRDEFQSRHAIELKPGPPRDGPAAHSNRPPGLTLASRSPSRAVSATSGASRWSRGGKSGREPRRTSA
jgi:putative ABC transport system ATP-binding protein